MKTLPGHPFRRRDRGRFGLTDSQIQRLVLGGRLRRPLHGVYCRSDLHDSVDLRARCAALVLPEHAVVCDLAAAWLWGIDLYDPGERYAVPRLDMVALRGHPPLRAGRLRGGERDLAAGEITRIGQVRLTTPVRTALDVACLRGRNRAIAGLDAIMRAHDLSVQDYRRGLARFRGRRGVTQARELVELATPLAESSGESWTRLTIIDAGFPPPEPQFSITRGGEEIYRIDLAYPLWKIAIEYVGEEFHGPAQRQADQRRIAWLEEHGWHVIVVDKEGLAAEGRWEWLAELARVSEQRSREGKRRHARAERPGRRTSL